MEGLTAGRMVHYVPWTSETTRASTVHGTHRAAVVCYVWNDAGDVDLQVFFDGENDGQSRSQSVAWRTHVGHDPDGARLGTWHFIERA